VGTLSAKKRLLAKASAAKASAPRPAVQRAQPFVPRVNAPPLGPAIEAYARELSDWRGLVVTHLCQLIAELAPTAAGMVKWGRAVYERNGPFAFVLAERHIVRLGFWRGSSLEDPEKLLAGGDGPMRHFNLWSPADVREERFTAWVREAVRLNQTLGDPTKPAP